MSPTISQYLSTLTLQELQREDPLVLHALGFAETCRREGRNTLALSEALQHAFLLEIETRPTATKPNVKQRRQVPTAWSVLDGGAR